MYSIDDMARIAASRVKPFAYYTHEDLLSEATLHILTIQDRIEDCPTKQAYLIKAARNHLLNLQRKHIKDKTCELNENIADDLQHSYELKEVSDEENDKDISVELEDLLSYCKPIELVIFKTLEQKMTCKEFCKKFRISHTYYYEMRRQLHKHLLAYFRDRENL